MPESYIKRILTANVYDVAVETPIDEACFLSKRFGNRILIKREDLQPVFSFKLRGAYNKMRQLTKPQREAGIICASAGNHAQGVALAAKELKIRAVIVMPCTTPQIKVDSVRERGGEVVLFGDNFNMALGEARRLEAEHGYTFIHPYDDVDVIAGQGTIGMEIVRQHSGDLDAVFVPVGGGGIIAGISAYLKYVRPNTKIIAVEPEEAACLKAALEAGERVELDHVGIFADGVAVKQIGEEPFRVCQHTVDEVITVTNDEMCAAIKDLFTDTRAVAEPAGALALAGLKKYVEERGVENQTLLAINSGANINFDRLRHVAERAEAGEHREALFAVKIPEKPGSFRQFCVDLANHDITEFNYRYADARDAAIFVGVKLAGRKDRKELHERLEAQGYRVADLSDDEMAKLHVRYMVGGHADNIDNEVVFRFQFPERPGALLQFLDKMQNRWNCSLFHYRNHGADYGRVLMALQVPEGEREDLRAFLEDVGYEFEEEQESPAYQLFLAPSDNR